MDSSRKEKRSVRGAYPRALPLETDHPLSNLVPRRRDDGRVVANRPTSAAQTANFCSSAPQQMRSCRQASTLSMSSKSPNPKTPAKTLKGCCPRVGGRHTPRRAAHRSAEPTTSWSAEHIPSRTSSANQRRLLESLGRLKLQASRVLQTAFSSGSSGSWYRSTTAGDGEKLFASNIARQVILINRSSGSNASNHSQMSVGQGGKPPKEKVINQRVKSAVFICSPPRKR